VSTDLLSGRYRLESVLGRGGMAAVWRAADTRLDRAVAVKLLAEGAHADPAATERFDQEARTVARLSHPHVVAVYDVGADGDRQYLVMELVEGTSLAALLADGPLDAARAVEIAAETCDALAAAHAAGVIHRDIKPANVLIDPKGAVKVCDFGIARLVGAAQPALTSAGAAIGTSQYMAPEQIAGGPVDARTDLYALGCVLYAMLTGAPPFAGDDPMSIAWQHLNRPPDPIGDRRPDLPPALANLVDSLLAKHPDERPQTASDVRGVLAALGAGLEKGAFPPTARHAAIRGTAAVPPRTRTFPVEEIIQGPPPRPARRSRLPLAAVATIVVLGVFLTAVLLAVLTNDADRGADPQGGGAAPTTTDTPGQPTETASPADRRAELITAVQQAVEAQAAAGQIDPADAEDIGKDLDELQGELAEGKDGKVAAKIRDVERKLTRLHRDGKITDVGWAAVQEPLTQLTADLPAGGDNGDQGQNDDENGG
jgi:serine/threonine-protein kinase